MKRYCLDTETVPYAIVDRDTGDDYPIEDEGIFETITGLLNEQDKKIKKLEQKVERDRCFLTDEIIRWLYSDLQRREYEKHCQGDHTYTLKQPMNNIRY